MRNLTLSSVFALLLLSAAGSGAANAAAWCAWYDAYTYNCGFHTFEQCLATVRGVGGTCYRNVRSYGEPARRRYERY